MGGGNTYNIQKIYGVKLGARRPYKETCLYTSPDGQRHDSITLSDEVTNYDVIAIDFVYSNGEINSQKLIDVRANTILAAGTNNILNINFDIAGQINAQIYVSNSTPLIMGFAGANGYRINDVIGISYGGSVKGRIVTSLYHGNSLENSIVLSDSYTNYDEIVIVSNTGPQVNPIIYNTDNVSTNNLIGIWTNVGYIAYTVTSGTVLTLVGYTQIDYITDIYGIKYDSNYITIDNQLNANSLNTITNKAVTDKINELEQRIIALEGRL